MQSHHWLGAVLIFLVGYVVARFWPQPGQAVGLP
jgi:hypothetical protein